MTDDSEKPRTREEELEQLRKRVQEQDQELEGLQELAEERDVIQAGIDQIKSDLLEIKKSTLKEKQEAYSSYLNCIGLDNQTLQHLRGGFYYSTATATASIGIFVYVSNGLYDVADRLQQITMATIAGASAAFALVSLVNLYKGVSLFRKESPRIKKEIMEYEQCSHTLEEEIAALEQEIKPASSSEPPKLTVYDGGKAKKSP